MKVKGLHAVCFNLFQHNLLLSISNPNIVGGSLTCNFVTGFACYTLFLVV